MVRSRRATLARPIRMIAFATITKKYEEFLFAM
jgi:hypothetical protein